MGKFVYRMCLLVILVIVAAGGMYYYKTVYLEEENAKKGTFVDRRDYLEQEADMLAQNDTEAFTASYSAAFS